MNSNVSPAAWALRRASLRGSPRPISGQVSPPERKSIPAGPGRAGGGSGASPLKSAARPAPRIPRHPLPASGVTLDFLTCRETVPAGPLRASPLTRLRPRRDLRDSHSHRAMSRRREHASETGESAARGGAGENAQGQDFPGAAPGRSGGKRRAARLRKSATLTGSSVRGSRERTERGCSLGLTGRGRAPAGIPGERDMQSWRKSPGAMRPSFLYRGERNPRLRSTARQLRKRVPALTLRAHPRHCAARVREHCHGMAPAPRPAVDNFPLRD